MGRTYEQDADRKRRESESKRNVVVPPCEDPARRSRLERDTEQWLLWYFSDEFTHDFGDTQKEIIADLDHFFTYGGDAGRAAPRGEGKSVLTRRVGLKYTLMGLLDFLMLFAATGTDAENALSNIKLDLETNERLAADYPEVCVPIREVMTAPQKANSQLVSGRRDDTGKEYSKRPTRFEWSGRQVVLPTVPGSRASGAIIMTRGLDAAVRGCNYNNKRPNKAVIDDADTNETARSKDQTTVLCDKVEKDISGLGGQKKKCARLFLCTLANNRCCSAIFTDPVRKPSFNGKRYRFLVTKPDRLDLWEEYVSLRQMDMQTGDRFARRAHKFYLENREAMDAGHKVGNVHRFDDECLPDGTQQEVSALQHYYNHVADDGPESAACELDNDPPAEKDLVESTITAHHVQKSVNGLARKVVPADAVLLTQGIDCRKVALHWVVRAWRADGTGYTIDYGVTEVRGTVIGSDDGVDQALTRAILERMEQVKADPYYRADGEVMSIDQTLVDSGWRPDAVFAACKTWGVGILPAKGYGKSAGCVGASFRETQTATRDKLPGDGWFFSRSGQMWLAVMDTDRWKAYEHDRWTTPVEKPGSMTLFGEPGPNPLRLSYDERSHHSYARHITSEVEVEELVRGVLVRKWKTKSDNNHYLDASYMTHVAANMKGIRLARPGEVAIISDPVPQASYANDSSAEFIGTPNQW